MKRRSRREDAIAKEKWAPGAWLSEPDHAEWTTAAGLAGYAKRSSVSGAWCGYVALPKEHPLYGIPYSGCWRHKPKPRKARIQALRRRLRRTPKKTEAASYRDLSRTMWTMELRSLMEKGESHLWSRGEYPCTDYDRGKKRCRTPESVLEVHGGITYGGPSSALGFPKGSWAFGFDCAHFMDRMPGMEATMARLGSPDRDHGPEEYRTLAFVKDEVESLARQLQERRWK